MNKTQSLSILLILSILFLPLVACTGAAGATTQSTGASTDLPLASQLALGTLNLDETSYPIDKAQAAELLPLWKALRALSSSDTTAPQEIEALVKQIQNILTAEQVKAITDMQLSNEDLVAFMQEQGPDGSRRRTPNRCFSAGHAPGPHRKRRGWWWAGQRAGRRARGRRRLWRRYAPRWGRFWRRHGSPDHWHPQRSSPKFFRHQYLSG